MGEVVPIPTSAKQEVPRPLTPINPFNYDNVVVVPMCFGERAVERIESYLWTLEFSLYTIDDMGGAIVSSIREEIREMERLLSILYKRNQPTPTMNISIIFHPSYFEEDISPND